MNKRGALPVILVMIVALAGLAVLILGTIEFLHGTLTGQYYVDKTQVSYEEAHPARAYLPEVIVQSNNTRERYEDCVLIPSSRPGVHILRCQ